MPPPATTPHFRFFDLPRELRDLIYEHLIIERLELTTYTDQRYGGGQVFVLDAITPNILDVNHKMHLEYKKQLSNRTRCLLIGSHPERFSGFSSSAMEFGMMGEGECTVYFYVLCNCDFMDEEEREDFDGPCDGADLLATYAFYLEKDVVPTFRSVKLKLGLWYAPGEDYEEAKDFSQPPLLAHYDEFREGLEELVALPNVEHLEIARCGTDDDYDKYSEGKVLPIIATWAERDGWRSKFK